MHSLKLTRRALLIALLFAAVFWIADTILHRLFFVQQLRLMMFEPAETFMDGLLFKISPYTLSVRISFLIACLIAGLISSILLHRLQVSEIRHKTYIQEAPLAIFIANAKGEYLQVNPEAIRLSKYSQRELLAMRLSDLHGDFIDFSSIMKQKHFSIENKLIKKDDSMIDVQLDIVQLPENEIMIFAGDISERKKSETMLKENLAEKNTLLKEVHHRVKNNLNIITSLLGIQSKLVKTREDAELAILDIQNCIYSMAMVHEKLLQSDLFSRINFAVYINELVNNLAVVFKQENKVTINYNLEDIELNVNQAIPCGIIINELITNALKHAFKGRSSGLIEISMKKDKNSYCRIMIRDDGIGLTKHNEPDKTSKLGIELTNSLARQLQGTLNIENNKGTVCLLAFPVQKADIL